MGSGFKYRCKCGKIIKFMKGPGRILPPLEKELRRQIISGAFGEELKQALLLAEQQNEKIGGIYKFSQCSNCHRIELVQADLVIGEKGRFTIQQYCTCGGKFLSVENSEQMFCPKCHAKLKITDMKDKALQTFVYD